MSVERSINLPSVMPDLDDLPANPILLKAFMGANGLLSTIIDLPDADDIRDQTAVLVSTSAEIIYADLRHTALSSETDNIFEIDDPDLRRAEAIKLLVADKREMMCTRQLLVWNVHTGEHVRYG